MLHKINKTTLVPMLAISNKLGFELNTKSSSIVSLLIHTLIHVTRKLQVSQNYVLCCIFFFTLFKDNVIITIRNIARGGSEISHGFALARSRVESP